MTVAAARIDALAEREREFSRLGEVLGSLESPVLLGWRHEDDELQQQLRVVVRCLDAEGASDPRAIMRSHVIRSAPEFNPLQAWSLDGARRTAFTDVDRRAELEQVSEFLKDALADLSRASQSEAAARAVGASSYSGDRLIRLSSVVKALSIGVGGLCILSLLTWIAFDEPLVSVFLSILGLIAAPFVYLMGREVQSATA